MDNKQFIAYAAQHKIVPVFFHNNVDVAIQVVQASYDAGIRIFEFVNRGETGLTTFKALTGHFSDVIDLKIGVGTIFDSTTAQQFIDSGAQFIVSPGLVQDLAVYCKEHKIAYIPGIGTITEAITAMQLGCDMIKLFPANVIGSAFAKAVKSVMPQLAIMPTGGIEPTQDSLKVWFDAGVNCIGMGSQLFDNEKIKNHDFNKLSEDISKAVLIANNLYSIDHC